jgi:Whirly transcription factor
MMMAAIRCVAIVLLLLAEVSRSFSLIRSICRTSIRSTRVENNERRSSTTTLQSSSDGSQERTFANYVIYKSKAAVSLKVIPPTFQSSGTKSRTVSREGGLFFEFALAAGPKEYDWTKKGTFLLSAAECGELLLFDASRPNLEFFHDPNMGAANAGISADP